LRVAAKFAARTVGAEIDRRWRILEDEADDPALIALMKAARGKPYASVERQALQKWIVRRFGVHQRVASAANWFLTDERGTQIARAPLIERSIGANYAFRDYFHGQGRDLPEGERNVPPIDHPHRSIVFKSRNTGRHIVVFSVPVWDLNTGAELLQDAPPPSKILGIMGMAVDVGRFGVLQLDVGDAQIAVLADLRPDDTGRRGLILHHPGLAMTESEQGMAYLSPLRLRTADRLRESALARNRARSHGEPPPTPNQRTQPLPGSFSNDYRDSVGGAYAGRWLAAFEPVLIEGRPDMIDDTGWVVIVQEREGDAP
jgi:hypothetical protein